MAAGSRKTAGLLALARTLYAEGVSKAEIARKLGVRPHTVARWQRADAKAGVSWQELRRRRLSGSPTTVLPVVAEQIAELVASWAGQTAEAPSEERVLKLVKIIERYRKLSGDLMDRLEAMEDFARFCSQNLGESEMATVGEAVSRYLEHLKREHS